MYLLSPVAGHHFLGPGEVYVLDIHRVGSGLAAITSDQKLALFNPARLDDGPISLLPTNHGNLRCLKPFDWLNSVVSTAGEDGSVSIWDLREDPLKAQVLRFQAAEAPIVSLACELRSHAIAVGTELYDHAASILLWDVRGSPSQRTRYTEVHSDDVTELRFHPTEAPNILLSGSTDGLVNIYDTRIVDEDDVIIQTLNHGSVHHAGFLSATEVYALSHDEKFAVFNLEETYEKGTPVADFGDVRRELECQYASNVTSKVDGSGAIIGVGSQARQMFQLVFLTRGSSPNSWMFDKSSSVGLPGGHGEEIVRAFCFYDDEQVVFTAGEDGNVKAWRPN
ncbi:WD domain-containing protein [Sodiomyces alkalinus F11]|uniref:WD domain-containing protein n=1 Tax=Sodiomyces alkalinus (strain CBS 110278 / VKM F-3762 / F11) TaxID=1314773 RepID=A0A3N2Q6J2_SODAK|nr:WD domain-containing protein [Sodiomyces alkalinus F11]ROT42326.1 WD domain-containing protein [Sodiomyces alkalinus F11]